MTPLSAFATDIVPVRVRQFVDGSQLAYLLVCPRTRAAALIDPLPSMVEHVGSVISEHELKLRFVLRTNPGLKPPANRYRSMLSSLGLSQSEGTPASPSAAVESFDSIAIGNLLQVGPAPARADARAAGEAVLLQAADDTVGVRLFDGNQALEPRFTVGGSLLGGPPPTAHICGSARVALGAFFVDVLPIAAGHVAYCTQDRLFTGSAPGRTPPVLLTLGDDVVVHPALMDGNVGISSIGQERRSNAELSASHAPEALSWPDSIPTSTS